MEDTNTTASPPHISMKQAIQSSPKTHTALGRLIKSPSAPPSAPMILPSSGFTTQPGPVSLDAKNLKDPLLFPSAKMLSNFYFNVHPMRSRLPKARALEWLHTLNVDEWDRWVEYYEAHENSEERTKRLAHDTIFNKTLARHKLEWARIQLEHVTHKKFPERTLTGPVTISKVRIWKKSPYRRCFNLKTGKIYPLLEQKTWSVFEPVHKTPEGIEENIKLRSFEEHLLHCNPFFSKGMVEFGKESGLRSSWTYTGGNYFH